MNSPGQGPTTTSAVLQSTNQTIQNSWKLFTMSWGLLWKQTIFPFITLIVSVGSALAFALFVYRLGVIQAILAHTHPIPNSRNFTTDDIGPEQTRNIFVVLGTLVGYMFLIHVFNFLMKFALSASTQAQLSRGTSGLGDGIGAIFRHFFTILGWIFVSGGVGFVTGIRSSSSSSNAIESMATNVTQGFFDSAWKIITFLTVPVIVAERVGPINGIKRSAQLVRDTWGRQLTGRFGIDAVMGSITGAAILVSLGSGEELPF
jgi:hypothetical protein